MSVNFKSDVTSNNVNSAFVSKTTDDEKTSKLKLNDDSGDSGVAVENTQKTINQVMDTSGETEGDAQRKIYATNNKIADGDSRKAAIEKLDVAVQANEDALTGINDSIGQPLGIASLDQNGKLPASQLTTSAFEYIGLFDANLCEPSLIDATTASFDAPVAGVTGNVQIIADSFGTTGNALIVGDGLTDLDNLIAGYNAANPGATLTLISLNGADIPDALAEIQLTGGSFGEATATFDDTVLGVTGNVQLTADTFGVDGNVAIIGDGATDLQTLVDNFNNSLPPITITLLSANGADIPDDLEVMQLSGGKDLNNSGDTYHVSVAGSCDFGGGSIEFNISDKVVYNGLKGQWEKWDTIDQVVEVNGYKGVVNLDTDDVPEGANNLYTEKDTKANLDALPRKEGKIYYATDEQSLYYDNGSLLKPLSGGYVDAEKPVIALNQGVEERFTDNSANATGPLSFACAGYMGAATGYTEPLALSKSQSLTVEIVISNYVQGEGDPYFTPTIYDAGFATSVTASTNIQITGDGTYSYTFTPAELATLTGNIENVLWEIHSNNVVVDTIANQSTTWLIDNLRAEQNSTDWANENLSSIPAYLYNFGFNTGFKQWVSSSLTAPYNVTDQDNGKILIGSTASGNISVILPEISTLTLPFNLAVQKAQEAANGNTVTIKASGTDEFNFNNTQELVIENRGSGYHLLADDSNNWVALPYLEEDEVAQAIQAVEDQIPQTTFDIDDGSVPTATPDEKFHLKTITSNLTLPTTLADKLAEKGSPYYHTGQKRLYFMSGNSVDYNRVGNIQGVVEAYTNANPPTSLEIVEIGKYFMLLGNESQIETNLANGTYLTQKLAYITDTDRLVWLEGLTADTWLDVPLLEKKRSINLLANQAGAVITELNIDGATYDGAKIDYILKSDNGATIMGTLRVAYSNSVSPNARLTDERNELGDSGITFDIQTSGSTIQIKYNSGIDAATITAELNKLKI